jgi:hypothetical protein
MIVSYNFIEEITNEEEETLLASKLNLFSIRIITLPDQKVEGP